MCGSARLNGVDLHIHVHEPPCMCSRNERKSRKSYEKVSKFLSEGDGGAKDISKSGSCKISKRSKIEKCVDCLCAHGSHSEKKVRHVGQSKVRKSHFDLANPYHADFDVQNSLCR